MHSAAQNDVPVLQKDSRGQAHQNVVKPVSIVFKLHDCFPVQTFTHQCVSYRSETVPGQPAEYLPAFGSQPVLNSDPVRRTCGNIQIFKSSISEFYESDTKNEDQFKLDIFINPAVFVFTVRTDKNASISMF